MRHTMQLLAAALALVIGAGCASTGSSPSPDAPIRARLRVGMTPNAPPIAFTRGDRVVGFDVDNARALAADLDRDLEIVQLPWRSLLVALQAGQIDVIMSGMTITPARQARVLFSDPYLRSGLAAVTRQEDAARYPSADTIRHSTAPIGVVTGTTGASWVRKTLPRNQAADYPTARAAIDELRGRRIDVFIHDIPMAVWFASANESDLRIIRKRLHVELLGWAFRPEDRTLVDAANQALARWKQDGSLAERIDTWLPYWSKID